MIWGTPAAWFLMAFAGPMVGLFLYRRRAVLAVVPSLAFWSPRDSAVSGSLFGRTLRHLPTLLFQLLILGLLVAALANPQVPRPRAQSIVIVLDCSATMQTSESGTTRLAQAIRVAEEIVNAAPDDSSFTVIRAGQFPHIIAARQRDRACVGSAIREIRPADVDSDLEGALSIASQIARDESDAFTYLISDFCGIRTERLHAERSNLMLKQVGSAQPNLGIIDLRLVSQQHDMTVVVGRNDTTTRPFEIVVTPDHGEQIRCPGSADNETVQVTLPLPLAPGERFQISLDPPDSLPLDNIAYGVMPTSLTSRVRLVSSGNPFLEQAILARGAVKMERVAPQEWANSSGADVTILDRPVLRSLSDLPGRFVVFSPVSDRMQPTRDIPIQFWAADHPVLRNLDPVSWGCIRGVALPALPASRAIVSAGGVPVVYEWPDPDSSTTASRPADESTCRAVVFNFDLTASELPYAPALPVVLWDAIDYLSGQADPQQNLAMPSGSVISAGTSVGETPLVSLPSGRTENMSRSGDRFICQHTEQQGFYFCANGQSSRTVAVNWMSMGSTEPFVLVRSQANPLTPGSFLQSRIKNVSWRELLIAIVILVVVEWALFHKRVLRMD